jgi:hypothetical protein
MNPQPGEALTKAAYDELVAKLGRPPTWPLPSRRRLGPGPDNAVPPANSTREERTQ